VSHLRSALPASSDEMMKMLVTMPQFGLTSKDASTLLVLDDGERLEYYLDVVHHLQSMLSNSPDSLIRIGRIAGNW
jgi:aspartyl-tRNA(Asn)/glutamyl-tRNA(Gln) amidotransferase subunit B